MSVFTPANTIESNFKTVDSIFTHTLGVGVDTLDSLDMVHLYNIAYQCPDMGGMGIYQARAMLNILTNSDWEFSDSCNTDTGRTDKRPYKPHSNPIEQNNELNAKVYPNPANSLLTIEVNLPSGQMDEICIYNSLGEKVVCEELEQNLTTLSTNNLSSGIYYYRITNIKGALIRSDKVMIIH